MTFMPFKAKVTLVTIDLGLFQLLAELALVTKVS